MLMDKVWICIQFQLEITASWLDSSSMVVGIRLMKNDNEIIDFTYEGYDVFLGKLILDRGIGVVRSSSDIMNDEIYKFITFIWSCTKFLVPKTNGLLLSFKSEKATFLSMGCRVSSSTLLSW